LEKIDEEGNVLGFSTDFFKTKEAGSPHLPERFGERWLARVRSGASWGLEKPGLSLERALRQR
jgi:hypothetical protein